MPKICLVLALIALSPLRGRAQEPAAAPDRWDARVVDYKGDVEIFSSGSETGTPPEKGMPLNEGDRIKTGEDASVDVSLDGGSIIHLSEATDFTLSNTDRGQTSFKLTVGTFLAEIQKLLAGQSMAVEAPTAVAAVRGTEFGVEVDPKNLDESHVGVFDEGKVEVRGQNGAVEKLIGGQETKVAKGQAPLHAYQLERFKKHRGFMRTTFRKRLQALRKTWKSLSPAERKALREKLMTRARERREKLKKELKDKGANKDRREKRGDAEAKSKREKMEKFRESIRNRKRSE